MPNATDKPLPTSEQSLHFTQEAGNNYIVYKGTRLPVGPWWVFLGSILLFPVLVFGACLWLAGAVIRWRYRGEPTPKDARFFLAVGSLCVSVFLWPGRLYFRLKSPFAYREWLLAGAKLRTLSNRWTGKLNEKDLDRTASAGD